MAYSPNTIVTDPSTGSQQKVATTGSAQVGQIDTAVSGTITTSDAVVGAPLGDGSFRSGASTAGCLVAIQNQGGQSSWEASVSGTLSGTYYFEGSIDSTNGTDGNWITFNGHQNGTTSGFIAWYTQTASLFRGNLAGVTWFRVRNVGGTSPNTTVKISISSGMGPVLLSSPLPRGNNYVGKVGLQGAGYQDTYGALVTSMRNNQFEVRFFDSTYLNGISTTATGTGSLTQTNGNGITATGTGTTSSCLVQTKTSIKYNTGHEIYANGTAAFTAPTSAASYQRTGIYNSVDGFWVGYNGLSFGLGYRRASVDTAVNQASFNVDTLTGSATSLFTRNGIPEALDPTKLNIYRFRYGWYGAASSSYEVYSPDGVWVLFHQIYAPNTNSAVFITNPNLPYSIEVSKTASDATNLQIVTGALSCGTTQTLAYPSYDYSTTNLASNASYTTPWFDASGASGASFIISTQSDQPIQYSVQYSPDQTILKNVDSAIIPANGSYSSPYIAESKYFRVIYKNTGASTTTLFWASTVQADYNVAASQRLQDATGSDLIFRNAQLPTADVISNTGQYRAQSVTTTAALALGASSALANRKFISLQPTNGVIYWGFDNTVTATTGAPIFKNQAVTFAFSVPIYVVSSTGTVDVRIAEGS